MCLPQNVEVAISRLQTLVDTARDDRLYEVECQKQMKNAIVLLKDAYESVRDMETRLNSSGAARTLAEASLARYVNEVEKLQVDAGELVVTQYELAAARTALREIDETPYMLTNDSESLRHTIKSIQATARRALALSDTSQLQGGKNG